MAHKEEYREKYDLVVSRAVAPLDILLEYDIPYLKNKGCALLLKSSNLNCEIEESKKALNVLNCKIDKIYDYSYEIKNELFTRKVVKIKKFNNTPIKYPRNYGKIKKCPL
jgi:16S rRNA (guanine527-N7)-methyltransferase